MRDTPLVTRRGVKVRIRLRRPVAEILDDWKADAVRRKTQPVVRKQTKNARAHLYGA